MSFAKQRQSSCYRVERDEARSEVATLRDRIAELEDQLERTLIVAKNGMRTAEKHGAEAAESRIRELEEVIRWALGEVGDFPTRQDGQGPYWWRKELRKRASLEIKPCTKICGS